MTSTPTETSTDLVPVVSAELMTQFAAMAVNIPENDDSDAYESIVAQLLGANRLDELNAPWETSKAEQLKGKRIRIESMTRRTSDYGEGLGLYLIIKGTDLGSGEKITLTIGSVAVVAQLARVHALNGLPAIVEVIIADRPTKNGYRPMHLKVYALAVNS